MQVPVDVSGDDDSSDDDSSDGSGDDAYEVERIIGKRVRDGRTEYHVKWAGCDDSESTWEPDNMVDGAAELVAEYEATLAAATATSASAATSAVSPVGQPAAQRSSARVRGLAPNFDMDGNAVVHMAMSAMSDMQTNRERMQRDDMEVVCAVSAGVGLLDQETPDTYRDAVGRPDASKWHAAMDAEMSSCAALDVWDYVPRASLEKGTNILPVKWVYKIKTDEHGDITSYKARLTPKGFKQQHGKDFFEVYAATGMYKTIRLGLSAAAKFDHELEQLVVIPIVPSMHVAKTVTSAHAAACLCLAFSLQQTQ